MAHQNMSHKKTILITSFLAFFVLSAQVHASTHFSGKFADKPRTTVSSAAAGNLYPWFLGVARGESSKYSSLYSSIEVSVVRGKLFYRKWKTVYMSNLNGKKIKKLFAVKDYYPGGLQIIAKNLIGYYNFEGRGTNVDTKIYQYNLSKKKNKSIKKVSGELKQLAFYSKNKYAYLQVIEKANAFDAPDATWSLHLVALGKDKKIKEWKGKIFGRGGYYEDEDTLAFSPNGKKILHIATSSVRDIADYNVYIFNHKKQIAKISEATHPVWVSNNEIVYRKYEKGYLYKYNLKTKKSAKIKKIPKDSFEPRYMPETNMIAFWSGLETSKTYTYNLTTKKLKMVKKNTVPINWLSADKLLVYKTIKADEFFLYPNMVSIGVLNLKTKKLKIATKDTARQYFTGYQ